CPLLVSPSHRTFNNPLRLRVISARRGALRLHKAFRLLTEPFAVGILADHGEHATHHFRDGLAASLRLARFDQQFFAWLGHQRLPWRSPEYSKVFKLVSSSRTRSRRAPGKARRRL